MKYNIVLHERIIELSEFESRFSKLRKFVSNWKYVAMMSIGLFTAKVAAEQLCMLLRSN